MRVFRKRSQNKVRPGFIRMIEFGKIFGNFMSDCTDRKLRSRPCPPAVCPRRRAAVGSAGTRGCPLLPVSSAPSTWLLNERPVRSRSETQRRSGFPLPAYHAGLPAYSIIITTFCYRSDSTNTRAEVNHSHLRSTEDRKIKR